METINLNLFKKHLKEERAGLEFYPYTVNKSLVFAYKTVFMTLGVLFLGASLYLYNSSLVWSAGFLFGNSINIKLLLCLASGVLGAAAAAVSLTMSPEREAAAGIVARGKKRARRLLLKRLADLRHARITAGGKGLHDSAYWRHLHEEALEKIEEYREEARLIIKRVQISKVLSEKEKEQLYNQALYELKSKIGAALEALSP